MLNQSAFVRFSAAVSPVFTVDTCLTSKLKQLVVVMMVAVFAHSKDFETVVFAINETTFSRSAGGCMY